MDNKLEYLWQLIEYEDIDLFYYPLQNTPEKALGLYIRDGSKSIIIIDKMLRENSAEYRCVLAHEVGHHFTAPRTSLLKAHTCYGNEVEMSKDEYRASVWATDYLIPDVNLINTILAGYNTVTQLAEQLFVAEWFMYKKIYIFKKRFRRLGVKLKSRDFLLPEVYKRCFESAGNIRFLGGR